MRTKKYMFEEYFESELYSIEHLGKHLELISGKPGVYFVLNPSDSDVKFFETTCAYRQFEPHD